MKDHEGTQRILQLLGLQNERHGSRAWSSPWVTGAGGRLRCWRLWWGRHLELHSAKKRPPRLGLWNTRKLKPFSRYQGWYSFLVFFFGIVCYDCCTGLCEELVPVRECTVSVKSPNPLISPPKRKLILYNSDRAVCRSCHSVHWASGCNGTLRTPASRAECTTTSNHFEGMRHVRMSVVGVEVSTCETESDKAVYIFGICSKGIFFK